MLARGAGVRPEIPLAPPSEGASVDELRIPDDVLGAARPRELLRLVQRSQQARIETSQRFDDVFEHLVTGGRADEYHGLVERFRSKFDAITSNLDRAAEKLSTVAPGGAVLAGMVAKVNESEARRLERQLELQVLRQRLSITSVEGALLDQEKAHVKDVEAAIKRLSETIFEALEELSAEAADLEDED